MNRWQLTTTDGQGLMVSQQRGDEWEVRAMIERTQGELKTRAFGPTEVDAKDGCLRNLREELEKIDKGA